MTGACYGSFAKWMHLPTSGRCILGMCFRDDILDNNCSNDFNMGVKLRAKILVGLIVAAGVVLVLVLQPNSYKRAVEAYQQQLRAQGEKLTIAELAPKPPPDSFEGAHAFLSAMSLARLPSTYPPAMKMVGPGRAMVAWQQEIIPEDKVSNIWPGLSLELQANHDNLSNLQSALAVPLLYFDLDYSKGFAVLTPHLAKLKQAEILTSVSAVAALHERKFSEAWTNLHAAVALVRLYHAEPSIISHLVRIAMANLAVSATWEFLQSDQWADAQLAELQSDWQAMEFFDALGAAFSMERAMSIDAFQLARKSYDGMMTMVPPGPTTSRPLGFFDDPAKTLEYLYGRYRYMGWKSSWSYDEELAMLQCSDATLKSIRHTELHGAFAPALKELDASLAKIDKVHTNAIRHFMFTQFGSVNEIYRSSLVKFADTEVSRRLLVTAIALKRYQLRHGKYPLDLNALVPELLPKVPVDFMDGKPLRYKPAPDGNFLLYSVGEDGEDNGGDPTPTGPTNTTSKIWYKGHDAVWPQPATAEEVAAYFKNLAAPATTSQPFVESGLKKRTPLSGTNGAGR